MVVGSGDVTENRNRSFLNANAAVRRRGAPGQPTTNSSVVLNGATLRALDRATAGSAVPSRKESVGSWTPEWSGIMECTPDRSERSDPHPAMALDFSRLGSSGAADTALPPREIFAALPAKDSKYSYPRDVQAEVWREWFGRRDERDVVVKMNTGSGKTVVGLLILKSCLNEEKGPAVYVAPDQYLAAQAAHEGQLLGLPIVRDPRSPEYARSRAILVVTIKELVNGQSKFGVGDEGPVVPIGSVIVDDAHASLAETENQFSIVAEDSVHDALLALFKEDLVAQSESRYLEIEAGDRAASMAVPYWAWQSKISEATQILHDARLSDALLFSWPLVKRDLLLARCVFGGGAVEVAPRCLPIDAIPSFEQAGRRVFMTATLADDGVLVTHFNVDPEAVRRTVTPSTSSDVGDRLILLPQALNPALTDDDVRGLAENLSGTYNVVVIVPSGYRAQYWAGVADQTLTAGNLREGVEKLRNGHVGLTVLVNKYDGVDLPGDACRVLVLDGLPDVRGLVDRIREGALAGSDRTAAERVQRIEQGMGRGVRSNDDHCAVLLMGSGLTRHLYVRGGTDLLTTATHAQLDLSDQIADQIGTPGVEDLKEVMAYCLDQEKDWVQASRGALASLKYRAEGTVHPTVPHERAAFDAGRLGQFSDAVDEMQSAVNGATDDRHRGWLKQELAAYTNPINAPQAQVIQKSALSLNSNLFRPLAGIEYVKLDSAQREQGARCAHYYTDRFETANHLVVEVNDLLDRLSFQPGTATSFEKAFRDLGLLIGHDAHRPEADYGRGPDVLWSVGTAEFFVIEAKNGAIVDTISKHDVNQLSGSMNWFSQKYGVGTSATPLLIHPSRKVGQAATAHPDTRVIREDGLARLRENVRRFTAGVAALSAPYRAEPIAELLRANALTPDTFVSSYSVTATPA